MLKKGFVLLLCLLQYSISGYANNSFYTEANDSICTYEYVEYNGKTICFKNNENLVMRAYVIELCNDSIKPDGKLSSIEYNYAVEDFLRENTVKETINEIKAIVEDYSKTLADINVSINGSGKIIRVSFLYYTKQKEYISAKDIFNITNEIMENIKFTPPEKFGCNIIKLNIPIR